MGLLKYVLRLFTSGVNDHDEPVRRPPRFFLRFFWSHPRLYSLYSKSRYGIDIFDPACDFVFDGFPRSGNTFGSRMLAATQERRVKVFSNVHCPPFILGALRAGKPVCLTIRAPEDAVVSWIIFKRKLSAETVLQLYIDFYTVLLPYRSSVLVLPFDLITLDFRRVLQLFNHRFQLQLRVPDDTTVFEQGVFDEIETWYRNHPGGFDPLKIALPNPERDKLKGAIRESLNSPRCRKLLTECQRLHNLFETEYRGQSACLNSLPLDPVSTER